jgi:hypothetical protein
MDQPVTTLEDVAATRLELAVVEDIWPLAALESVMEEIRPTVGMQPCLV